MGAEFGEDLLRRWFDRARLVRGGASVEDLAGIDATDADFRQLFGALLRQSFDGIVLNATASRWILEVSDSFCCSPGTGGRS